MAYSIKITKGWHITLPLGLRREMNIQPGDIFSWKVISQNAVLIKRVGKITK